MMAKTKFRKQLINGLKNPATILGDAWEFASCWVKYCSWSSFFILASPGIVIFLAISILFGIGAVESKKMILLRYVTAAEKIAPIEEKKETVEKGATEKPSEGVSESSSKESTKEDKAKAEAIDQEAMLYFRRILQLEKENKRARYYVALRYASQQALPQARKMMESLAPAKVVDYMPAHIWMAMDLIAQARSGVKVDQAKLEHHLKTVCESESPPSGLLFAYAALIRDKNAYKSRIEGKEDDKWKGHVSELLKKAARDRNVILLASDWERELGNQSSADQMSETALLYFRQKAQQDPKDVVARLSAAKALFQKKEYENAKKFLLEGMLTDDLREYRDAYSDICIAQFQAAEADDKFYPIFLEDAIAKAPWNPKIGIQLAALMGKEVVLSDTFRSALLAQVTERTASPFTYLMLGSIAVKRKNMAEGIKYLELAYKLAPNAPLVINNYAMALTMTDTPDWKRANELIDTALKIDPRNSEVHDSKGRILVGLGDFANAVTSFDIALQLKPDRIDSRTEIIKALEKTGMQELANAHRTKLNEVLKKKQENPDKKD